MLYHHVMQGFFLRVRKRTNNNNNVLFTSLPRISAHAVPHVIRSTVVNSIFSFRIDVILDISACCTICMVSLNFTQDISACCITCHTGFLLRVIYSQS